MAGVGKTGLAVKFAHAAAPDYPDGQYFVDLQGFATERGPLGPADALDVLLQQHGLPPESIPPDLDARSAVWRAEMAGKKAIILLDNAVDTKQVRPLLPGAGGPLVVVTSRRRLVTLVSASSMSLGPLDLQDARRLFVRIAGADRASADDGGVSTIVEHCGRLPLAIRIAAARFRDRPSWTLSYLTRLFEGAKRRLPLLQSEDAGVGAALALSHSHLPSETARLFRLLSVCPGPEFDVRAAAAIARVTEDEAGMVLESLFDDNLILQDDPGWYSFHDLIRECATELCALLESEQDVQLAHERLVDSYLSRATVWCEGLARGPFRREADVDHIWPTDPEEPVSEPESYEVLGRHSRNLIETARSALGRSTPRRAWQMVCAIQPLLRQRNYPGDSLELFEQAASKARDIEDLEGESLCLMGMALVLRERFQIERAMKTFEDALALSRQAGDADLEMSLLTELGIAMVQGERHEEARRYFEQAQRAARELDEKGLLAALSTNLGVVCRALGASAEGLGHLDRALRDHRELGEPLMQAMDLLNIGSILLQDGRFAESEKHLTEASRMECLFVGQAGMISATAYAHLAVVRRILGDDSMSADNGRNALALARELHMPDIECEALNALGESFLGAADLQGAEASFRQ